MDKINDHIDYNSMGDSYYCNIGTVQTIKVKIVVCFALWLYLISFGYVTLL